MPDGSLRIVHLCYCDDRGGAAIGSRRLHQAMRSQGLDSRLIVVKKFSDDPNVIELPAKPGRRALARRITSVLTRFQKSGNPVIRTPNILPMGTAQFLNSLDADIVQCHWIGTDTISIGELTALNKPVVWKLPDMWGFSGAEHYINPGDPARYRDGYLPDNRPAHESGLDLDRLIWRYKRWRWRDAEFNIVGPSNWISNCARESILFGRHRIRCIPNPLDLELYAPRVMREARKEFGLPQDRRLIMFGAMQATSDRRKGFQHLQAALDYLPDHLDPATTGLVVLGADGPEGQKLSGFGVHYLGTIRDENRIVEAYNAADAFVLPAEADNLPNVVKEATCCGVPCAGFDVGGMPDMVDHLDTGYLAKPFDARELAAGIAWTVNHATPALRSEVRARAEAKHAQKVAVDRYLDYYGEILGRDRLALSDAPDTPASPVLRNVAR